MRLDSELEHYQNLYQIERDSQYLPNKLRELNANCLWLVEPWVLKNPHEIIPLADFNEKAAYDAYQVNGNSVFVYTNNCVQFY